MYERHILGKKGEDIAAEYLKNLNYTIIERNFYCRQGEIDIIAKDKEYLVFIEIKARTSIDFGLPSEAVTKRKMKHMLKTIKYYLHIYNLENKNIRIDVIEVFVNNEKYRLNHLKQVV